MHKGSCLCGAVRYEIEGELGPIYLCHCSRCRKASGSAFASNSPVKTEDFRVIAGHEVLTEFESSPGVFRAFCRGCGSPIYSKRHAAPGMVRIRIGTLDTPVSSKPLAHIFVASKAEWFEIHDQISQHADRPP